MRRDKTDLPIPIVFATKNSHKVYEIQTLLQEYPVTIIQKDWKSYEIQSEDLEEIVTISIKNIMKNSSYPTFVEDTGLFIEMLNGFPGTYAAYINKTIGLRGILKLLEGEENRKAVFKSVIAFCKPDRNPLLFHGSVEGRISLKERGSNGFGFDPIFEPKGSSGKTFGEMDIHEKNKFSHRAFATRNFIVWLLESGLD